MKKIILIISVVVMLAACDQMKNSARSYESSHKTIWTYVEVESASESSDYRYYLFGEMKENLFNDISNNVIESGFFMLTSVKYYDTNNIVANYSDDLYTGNLVFRIEDIQMIKKLKQAPEVGIVAADETDDESIEESDEK